MTAKNLRLVSVLILSAAVGLAGVGVVVYLTWPQNSLGVYLQERWDHQQSVRALEHRIAVESDPATRAFYQAWLDEENGELGTAILGFRTARDRTPPASQLYLRSSLRLGLAYGLDGQSEKELAIYQGLMGRYPGPSRLSQALFHLRRGEREQARILLDLALEWDLRDGSLGSYRVVARSLRQSLMDQTEERHALGR